MVEWISDRRFIDNVTPSGYTSDPYLETVFASVTAPCHVEIEPFDRDIGRLSKRQAFEIERGESLQVLCSLGT